VREVVIAPPELEVEADPENIFIIGEVNNPGSIPIDEGLTLLQTLALAGGVTDFAAVKRIQLRRVENGSERVYNLNYQSVLDGVSNVGRAQMQAGDVIVVPARRLFE
jgi:polysaccharide export outer membrane protein